MQHRSFRGLAPLSLVRGVSRLLLLALALPWLPCPAAGLRFTLTNRTQGPSASRPVFVTVTGLDADGRFVRMDRQGRFHLCRTGDNTVPRAGTTWCAYSFPLSEASAFTLAPGAALSGGRLYLSADAPLYLRVDPATGGLVQPDLSNPTDPNLGTTFDWVEFALDATGFHGNTTCVDQFGLPITLEAVDGAGASTGVVGLTERRSDLFRAFRDALPAPFQGLVAQGGLRILSPAHAAPGALLAHLDGYIQEMWDKYRMGPLVLTPDEGVFTGKVDARGRLVFTRKGEAFRYVITAMPTTLEAFRCDGPLASGNALEKVLGAQIAAMLNRHLLGFPTLSRETARFYETGPSNSYARFWHEHGLRHKAYGFAYDDVNDQSTLINAKDPREIRIGFRLD